MAKRIVILERLPVVGARRIARVAFRADVPAARQSFYANPAFVSAYTPGTPDAQDTSDLAALRAGQLAETVIEHADETPDGTQTLPQYLAGLVTKFNAYQTAVTNDVRFAQSGSFWNGTTWTAAGA